MGGGTVSGVWRAPVTPACETQYTNEVEEERDVTNLMRCVDDSGVLSMQRHEGEVELVAEANELLALLRR